MTNSFGLYGVACILKPVPIGDTLVSMQKIIGNNPDIRRSEIGIPLSATDPRLKMFKSVGGSRSGHERGDGRGVE